MPAHSSPTPRRGTVAQPAAPTPRTTMFMALPRVLPPVLPQPPRTARASRVLSSSQAGPMVAISLVRRVERGPAGSTAASASARRRRRQIRRAHCCVQPRPAVHAAVAAAVQRRHPPCKEQPPRGDGASSVGAAPPNLTPLTRSARWRVGLTVFCKLALQAHRRKVISFDGARWRAGYCCGAAGGTSVGVLDGWRRGGGGGSRCPALGLGRCYCQRQTTTPARMGRCRPRGGAQKGG